MNILHSIASLDGHEGGPSRSVPALVAALRGLDVTVELAVWKDNRMRLLGPAPNGTELFHVHGLWVLSNHATAMRARRRIVPLVVSPRGMLESWALNHRRWKKRVAWHLYQRTDLASAALLHATSEAEAEGVRRAGMMNALAVIPNGVDVPASLPPRPISPQHRALFLSRLHPIKGLSNLVAAWAQVQPEGWELIIAGPDEDGHRTTIEAQAHRLELNRSVRFIGPVDDQRKWALYRSADLFVLPTHSENFGLVVAEALAAEVPVITTKGAPWLELETHRCGWWTDIGAEPLAAALREAVTLSDEQRSAMGARGRVLVQERYTWNRAASAMREAYEWILSGSDSDSAPSCIRLA